MQVAPDFLLCNEIHGRACHRLGLPEGNQGVVGGQILGCVEAQDVLLYAPGALSVQIEIYVVREVHHRGCVGYGRECEFKFIVFRPDIARGHLQVAGIAHFPIGRKVHEFNCVAVDAAVPNLVLETLGAAVQMVGPVVDG